jgi:hypothetical protein
MNTWEKIINATKEISTAQSIKMVSVWDAVTHFISIQIMLVRLRNLDVFILMEFVAAALALLL